MKTIWVYHLENGVEVRISDDSWFARKFVVNVPDKPPVEFSIDFMDFPNSSSPTWKEDFKALLKARAMAAMRGLTE